MRTVAIRCATLLAGAFLALALVTAARAAAELGSPAPAFKLQDQDGKWHSLSDYSGQWLVLYFYPKDMTPGCTTQACDFRDNIFAFRKVGAAVLGISVDDVESHKKFAEEHGLPFPILADPSKQTTRDYGVLRSLFGMKLASRETFIIDPHGKIVKHYPQVDPKGHSQVVLKDLQALQKSGA
ncbi:MAG TPA: peroxiredoxin [Steroidobacteraceae bacterium]|nr:peroxiredoxin [Steroidobacteraceae bacterium]